MSSLSGPMPKNADTYDVIVVGGGAAGMMAAGVAAANSKRVLLIEKNRKLGEKLSITGGGRCNIANAEEDERKLLSNFGSASNFLHSPFSQFGVAETFRFFESIGTPTVVEARNRAFPWSKSAPEVTAALFKYVKAQGVDIKIGLPVARVQAHGGKISHVLMGGKEYTADSYIFATGGVSHPETGSTGDGFRWLAELGHSVENPTPTIVPLRVKEAWSKSLAGITIKDMKMTVFVDGVKKQVLKGDVLLTHFGISGPLILNAAGKIADLMQEGEVTAHIDAYPLKDLGILDKHIASVFNENKNKELQNVFRSIAPMGTSDALLSLVPNIDRDKRVHSVTKEERRRLAELLKALPLTITGLMGLDRAVVADGGVALTEIDTKTMRSKVCENLFVIGDLLNIKRPTGGYSLQLCWTTGYVAGKNA
ncbi:MAG: aminoacetone oxidase family FAD-binding enzyme [Patescibacteria group bacterium]